MEQHLIPFLAAAVQAVADDRRRQSQGMGGVYPQLMGAAGKGCQGDAGVCSLDGNFLPEGDSHLAVLDIVNLPRTTCWIEPEGKADFAAVFSKKPLHHRCISFVYTPLGKTLAKTAMCLGGHGKDHEAGGEHVQPVHRRLSNHEWKEATQSGGGTICFFRPSTGYRQESSRLIDDDDVRVVVENFQGYRWSEGLSGFAGTSSLYRFRKLNALALILGIGQRSDKLDKNNRFRRV